MMRRAAVISLAVLTVAGAARTAEPSADASKADSLFRDGRRLMAEGDLGAACPMLAKSLELDPSSGTMLNLARCHELQGRLATAWTEYLAAERLAMQQGKQERADEARTRAATLLPRVPYVVLRVSDAPAGLTILRDDESVLAATWGTKLPVDPGTHSVTAAAPGRRDWKTTVTVVPGETREVLVPPLEPIASTPPTAPPPPTQVVPPPTPKPAPAPDVGRHASAWPWLVGGSSVVLLGVGAWAGVSAIGDYRDADRACPAHVGCAQSVLDQRDRAQTKAWVANVTLGLGLVAAGGATWLFLRTGDAPRTGVVVGGPALAYVGFAGTF